MWKLGLWPRYSFSGNICFQFSVLVLCSAGLRPLKSTNLANQAKKFTISYMTVQCFSHLIVLNVNKGHPAALIKKKIKFSLYIRKFRVKQLQSHIWLTASSYMGKYLLISSYNRKPFPIWHCNCSTLNFLIYEENLIFFFISAKLNCIIAIIGYLGGPLPPYRLPLEIINLGVHSLLKQFELKLAFKKECSTLSVFE